MAKRDRPYHAYLLRCWREDLPASAAAPDWRFVLEEVLHNQRRWGFGSLDALLAFLQAELADQEGDSIGHDTQDKQQET